MGGEALFRMASEGKLGFNDLNSALQKATAEGGKFYKNTAREARTLKQSQEQTAKMSEKLFLQIGQALEPMMMGFEKVKQFLIVGVLTPIVKITGAVLSLYAKLVQIAGYIVGKYVEALKMAFRPIIALFTKVGELAGKLWGSVSQFLGLSSKKSEEEEKAEEPSRVKKYDPKAIADYDKQMMQDYEELQKKIFKMKRDIHLKPYEEQLKATRQDEAFINERNKEFLAKYSASFDNLNEANQKTLAGIEKIVSDFAQANHDFVNAHKDLKAALAEKEREILTLPYREQERATRKLAEEANARNKEFFAKYIAGSLADLMNKAGK
ncbi:hypothetical protein [Borrelia sp. P9F1]|uniref:hypothetical protein n=1 Tax=Borrelia sp. P9F1 TaxID=3058374 RepID=UPI002647B37D|nr:hypothetical protein [Borrelia sp. P9F1]WKC58496.1 hypothetical protein QYZ68_04775 [Borrelia sp. P9F1]